MTSPEQQLRHALATRLETPPGQHYSEVMRRYAPNSAGSDDEFMYFYYALFQTFLGPGNRLLQRGAVDHHPEGMENKLLT